MGNDTTLWADYQNNYFNRNFKFETNLNQSESIQKAYEVMWKLPKILLNHEKDAMIFGCPDCNDGCGIYIEFRKEAGGETKKIKLDLEQLDNVSEEITDYANFVNSKISEIMK